MCRLSNEKLLENEVLRGKFYDKATFSVDRISLNDLLKEILLSFTNV